MIYRELLSVGNGTKRDKGTKSRALTRGWDNPGKLGRNVDHSNGTGGDEK